MKDTIKILTQIEELIEHYAGKNVNIALSNFNNETPIYNYEDLEKTRNKISNLLKEVVK